MDWHRVSPVFRISSLFYNTCEFLMLLVLRITYSILETIIASMSVMSRIYTTAHRHVLGLNR